MIQKLLFFLFLFLLNINLEAQQNGNCSDNQFLVQFSNSKIASTLERQNLFPKKLECLHAGSNIYLLEFDINKESLSSIGSKLLRHSGVLTFQKNCEASPRSTVPNDNLFSEQWSLNRIGATEFWNIGQGTTTPVGDTIVIAILDDGFDIDQEDLFENIWYNREEVQSDGQDNDGNGYIDDYFGLELQSLTDEHSFGSHGTAVAGIIGARTNNEMGISGIAWNPELMLLSNTRLMDQVLRGLYYAYEQRKKYNETEGDKGAFVVATNYSQGFDQLQCEEFPLFDQAYDSLGSVGILSVGASPNQNWNIDQIGDIPASCSSDFVISVTNTTKGDVKEPDSAYGLESIDLGAPGTDILTTYPLDEYKDFTGTSGSTPHVAGAIALLYSAPCSNFQNIIKENPEFAAREIKRFLMEGIDPINSLKSITKSGGRLNVWNAFLKMAESYGNTGEKLTIDNIYPNPATNLIKLEIEIPRPGLYLIEIFDSVGRKAGSLELPGYCLEEPYQIDISDLKSGFYFIRMLNGEEILSAPLIIL